VFLGILRLADNPEAHNSLGFALINKGKYDEEVMECRTATRINPNLAEAHANLALALYGKGDPDGAIT
jgi:Flp pilus assembly protein TadD